MEDVEISGWERSKLTNQDKRGLKKLGLLKKKDSLIFPGGESAPNPRIGYRVTSIDHLIRGLSTPVHEFLRGLLFVYGIQLHQLTPNSILGSQSIGFRNEADTLKGNLHFVLLAVSVCLFI
jgi:hypothetical protein